MAGSYADGYIQEIRMRKVYALQKHTADRSARPANGLLGRFSSPTYTNEQKTLLDNIAAYDGINIEGIDNDYATFIRRGRDLFPEIGAFPRLERMFHTGKDKSGAKLIEIPAELQKGGKRRPRRRQTRRKRGRRSGRMTRVL